jgi:succinate dehydrogenase / fumarate reductase cytochrome b subunit
MIFSGLILLLFVVIHVKQFKFGSYYQTVASADVRDLYRTEIEIFTQPLWVAFYVLGTLAVGLHLRHGIASGFQSIGFDHPTYTRRLTVLSTLLAILIGGGLAIIPVWVFLTR